MNRPSYRYSISSSSRLELFRRCKDNLDWQQEELTMFGRMVKVPRKVAFIGDQGLCYRYSGKNHYGQGWPDWLWLMKEEAQALAEQPFNSVLLNWYRDGEDYMGWHSDDERVLGPAPVVAMLSLGAERDFVLRRKDQPKVKHSLCLEDGSWFVMGASVQVLWQHTLPKRKAIKEERISLTFRLLLA